MTYADTDSRFARRSEVTKCLLSNALRTFNSDNAEAPEMVAAMQPLTERYM